MPYPAIMNLEHPGLDYLNLRPMQGWEIKHLNLSLKRWLSTPVPHLELATLAFDELKRRRAELAGAMLFAERDLVPIAWLQQARQAVLTRFHGSQSPPKRGALGGTVYAILRDGYTPRNGTYGVYVGSTARRLDVRFREHRISSKAGRGLIAHGIEPLYSLFCPLGSVPKAKKQLLSWETMLHECLAPVVPKVSGDVAF